MQSTSNLQFVPPVEKPRRGQERVWKRYNEETPPKQLNIKLPTGYGKTITALGSYYILKKRNLVNRLLVILPTNAQLDQLVKDGPNDLQKLNIGGPVPVIDAYLFQDQAIRLSHRNEAQVFCVSIQSLSQAGGNAYLTCKDIMSKGNWLVVVDEYHHYGLEKVWGETINRLQFDYLLAMSATPYRKDDDSAFGAPDIIVKYREAEKEGAVKKLKGHSYKYRIDAITQDGDHISYGTGDFIREAGSRSPDAIEKEWLKKKFRWSPKYVSELVSTPIDRMIANSNALKQNLQAIVGCLCVSHAKIVCKQIADMYPYLNVDWVGTGKNGRKPEENKQIIEKFCPQKDPITGKREHTLDVLVHVGMAGEGLDSTNVSEVIHLNAANINNSNNQENGRAARYLEGVMGHINFDEFSGYAKPDKDGKNYVGYAIMDAMDYEAPGEDDFEDEQEETKNSQLDFDDEDIPRLSREPFIQLRNVELLEIDSGELLKLKENGEFDAWMKFSRDNNAPYDFRAIALGDEQACLKAAQGLAQVKHAMANQHNKSYLVETAKKDLAKVVGKVASIVVKKLYGKGRVEKTIYGDITKRINSRKKYELGEVKPCEKTYEAHYRWMVDLEDEIFELGVPSWLQ